MRSSSAPASPACTCCTGCAGSAFRPASSRPATASAAPGTGTAIPAPAATSRAWSTPTPSPTSSSRNGNGPSATPRSPRSCATPTMSPTGSTCGATSSSRPGSPSAIFDEAADRWDDRDRPRRRRVGPVLHHGDRLPLEPPGCRDFRASRPSRAPTYHTGHWPHEGVDFTGQRVAVIGTGSSGHPVDPGHRRSRPTHLTVFQRTPELQHPVAQRAARSRSTSGVVKAELREHPRAGADVAHRHPRTTRTTSRPWRSRPRSAAARVRGALGNVAASASWRPSPT